MIKFQTCLLFCLSMFCLDAVGQNMTAINKLVQEIVAKPEMKEADFGFSVRSVEDNTILAEYESQQALIPASTLKTVTTASALILLGGDYQYETQLAFTGDIDENGELIGDIIIIGSGDPTLGSPNMEGITPLDDLLQTFVDEIKALGIKSIKGQIIGDGTCFESATTVDSWQWNDIGNYYGAGVSGLNIHENLYFLDFSLSPSSSKGPKVEGVRPEIPYLIFHNELSSGSKGSGDNAYIYGAPYTYTRHIRGTLPQGSGNFTIKGSLPDAPFIFAHWLTEKLMQNGVLVKGGISTRLEQERFQTGDEKPLRIFYKVQSPKLSTIVNRANKESVNLFCESLLKTIGLEVKGAGSTAAGIEAIQALWEERGISWEGIQVMDGSGLSPRNSINTNTLSAILRKMALDESHFDDFWASLSIAGRDGTLSGLLKGTVAEGVLRAKSGTMGGVRGYCGYSKTRSGKLLAFSIQANNFSGRSSLMRQRMERLMLSISQLP